MESSGVAHFFSRMEPAGAELRTIGVVSRTGLSFDFYALSGDPGTLDNELEEMGHTVRHLRLLPYGVFRLWREMRTERYRVAHCHLGLASGVVLLVAALAGVPIRIAHFRSDAVGGKPRAAKSLYLAVSRRLVNVFANNIVGVSPGSLERGWCANWQADPRCQVIPNGFDADRLRTLAKTGMTSRRPDRDRVVVSNIGRVDPAKNRGRAIQIWHSLAAYRVSDLFLVGELNPTDRECITFQEAPNGSRIIEIGDTRDVPRYLGESDVLLVTSTREGLPGVVLEALAVGTPVVSSTLPGSEWIASLLPGITLCSLDDDNSTWTTAIEAAARLDRNDIMAGFDDGPFTLTKVMPRFENLWRLNEASVDDS